MKTTTVECIFEYLVIYTEKKKSVTWSYTVSVTDKYLVIE